MKAIVKKYDETKTHVLDFISFEDVKEFLKKEYKREQGKDPQKDTKPCFFTVGENLVVVYFDAIPNVNSKKVFLNRLNATIKAKENRRLNCANLSTPMEVYNSFAIIRTDYHKYKNDESFSFISVDGVDIAYITKMLHPMNQTVLMMKWWEA